MNRLRMFALVALATALAMACVAPIAREKVGTAAQAITPTCIVAPDVADGMVRTDTPTSVNGTAPSITASYVLSNGVPVTRHALLRFDLSGIPAGATLTSVNLALWGNLNPSGYANIHPSNSPYSETTTNWNNAPTFGATVATVSGTGAIPAISLPTSSLTANGYTLEVESTGTLGNQVTIASREDTNAARRPTLTVCYLPAPTCSDGVQNGSETGVDCGGSCPACPTCSDGVQNQGETGIDCGGPCAACPPPGAGAGGSDAGPDAGSCPPGGEAITPITSCGPWVPNTNINATTYSYGADPAQKADVYVPVGTAPSGGWPLVVLAHPGGFMGGGRADAALVYYCRVLANGPAHLMPDGVTPMHSVACASIDYRLMSGNYPTTNNPYPAAVNDAQSAHDYLVSNAAALGINASRIGWFGMSAGGHLAGKVVGAKQKAFWYSNLHFSATMWPGGGTSLYNYLGCANGDSACVASAAVTANVTPQCGDPPALLSHATYDGTVSYASSQQYVSEALAAGVNATLVTINNNWHGYQPTVGGPAIPSNCTAQLWWQSL